MSDPIIKDAIQIRDHLLDVAKEIRHRKKRETHSSTVNLMEYDAAYCEAAAAMLQKLGTEITRLRLTIRHFDQNMMDRTGLRNVVRTWNDSEPIALPRLPGMGKMS
jgi:hypothetical protein